MINCGWDDEDLHAQWGLGSSGMHTLYFRSYFFSWKKSHISWKKSHKKGNRLFPELHEQKQVIVYIGLCSAKVLVHEACSTMYQM